MKDERDGDGGVGEDEARLTRLLKGENIQVGIHDATLQAYAERGYVEWTETGWKIASNPPELIEELRRLVATEMLGKDDR